MTGSFDLVIFSEPFAQYGSLLRAAVSEESEAGPKPVIVAGNLEPGEPPKILVRMLLDLAHAEEKLATQLKVQITAKEATRDRLTALKEMLGRHPGSCEVVLQIVIPDESETWIALPGLEVLPSEPLRNELNGMFGRCVTEVEL